MTVCSKIKGYARHHEWVADFSSLLAVVLLFGSIWFAIYRQTAILDWMGQNAFLYGPAIILLIMLDILLIFVLLNIGAVRFNEEGEEERGCFHTFRGRRHGGFSLGTAFHNWIDHIEHVNKKHR
jgi:uncharacterized membrane protein